MGRVWEAQPRQEVFLQMVLDQSESAPDEILFGGAAGGGKTDALLIACIMYCKMFPGIRVPFFRRTYPALEEKPIPRSKELLTGTGPVYNESKHFWTFPNGSVLRFASLMRRGDEDEFQSGEYPLIAFDELTQFDEYQYTYMQSRNRVSILAPDGSRIKPKMVAGTNPGGRGHAWVKRRWVTLAKPETVFDAPETPEEAIANRAAGRGPRRRVFVPAKLRDNQALMRADPGYEARLLALPNPNLRKALRDGDWDIFEGQAFPEWAATKRMGDLVVPWHVVEPFTIPKNARRWKSGDWGYTRPYAFLWFAMLDDGITYVTDELYGCVPGMVDRGLQRDAKEVGGVIRSYEAEMIPRPGRAFLDPACFNKQGHNAPTIAEALGGYWEPAENDRLLGKNRVHTLLAEDPDKHLPRLRVFSRCVNLIRTLPELPLDEDRPEDVDTETEDHLYDALRYGVLQRTARPLTETEQKERAHKRRQATRPRVSKRTGY